MPMPTFRTEVAKALDRDQVTGNDLRIILAALDHDQRFLVHDEHVSARIARTRRIC